MTKQTTDCSPHDDDTLLTLAEACRLFLHHGQPIHPSCIVRWAKEGVADPDEGLQ